jgi:hypothetical protein
MPTGSSDYDVILNQINETQKFDTLELAARLNAIASYNRTGQQVLEFGDAMIYSNQHWTSSDGLGSYRPSNKYGAFNRPSLKVTTSTTNGASCTVQLQTVPFGSLQLGMASFFICGSFNCTLEMDLWNIVNTKRYRAGIQLNMSSGATNYYKSDGTWASIGTFKSPAAVGYPMALKFTADFNAMKYLKLYFGNEVWYDLSAYVPFTDTYGSVDFGYLQISITNNTAASNFMYFVNNLITINEV